jgi:hypothetical protein
MSSIPAELLAVVLIIIGLYSTAAGILVKALSRGIGLCFVFISIVVIISSAFEQFGEFCMQNWLVYLLVPFSMLIDVIYVVCN